MLTQAGSSGGNEF